MLGDFIRDISPERAKEEALALCEAACGLPPRPGAPEKSRRELIALRQRPIGFCGKKELLAALEGCGLVSPELEEEGLAIRILAEGAREEADPGGVFILAKGLIPAHLSVKEGCEWDRLDRSKTPWEEADARAKSWDELKFTRLYSNCKK
jgi:hypothetical protein